MTYTGAQRAAERWNALHTEENRGGIAQAIGGTKLGPFWCPVPARELASLRSNHTVRELGSVERHPAGRHLRAVPIESAALREIDDDVAALRSHWCQELPESTDPVTPDGDITDPQPTPVEPDPER